MAEMFQGGVHRASRIRRAVVIGNGFAGAENQSIGLVRALGLWGRQSLHRVTRPRGGINEWLHWLPLSLHRKFMPLPAERTDFIVEGKKVEQLELIVHFSAENGSSSGLSSDVLEADAKQIAEMARQTFDIDGPLLVVASGRDTIPVSSAIKHLAPENVFVVQIQHPRSHLNRGGLPTREPPGSNVVLTLGALHQADFTALRNAASSWHAELAPLPRPLLVVNIGGPARNCSYGVDLGKRLAAMLQNVLWSCGCVRISFSRRTPEKLSRILMKEFGTNPKVYIWDGEGRNPHMGHLACADAFVITADSVSMLSEACSTGKPVYVIGAEHCTWKFADFQNSLQERGVVRPFTGKEDMFKSWSYTPLNDTAEAASRVKMALAERGWSI
ncbi:mitochondrial fission protein ELM1 isoform X1 [Prunus yedoensis var. nudiflora]|uniref:Mitochondrial fission protein ELM1 isoform X1 n=1 Tax=Prunus yedoensis var. nudiflora TaxID=2094558 RepID=A0A314ZNB6_PRUYE|nr:mitochondrial fission protein ELM1 isoform X1 [Prunus yedoensis var. nudiflora]